MDNTNLKSVENQTPSVYGVENATPKLYSAPKMAGEASFTSTTYSDGNITYSSSTQTYGGVDILGPLGPNIEGIVLTQ